MIKIHILEIDAGLEAHALRAAAEYWGAFVTVTWVGNSRQIVDFFVEGPEHEVIIICGHGDERGLLLPELAADLSPHYPYREVIRPEDFIAFLHLNANTVVNTSCLGGTPRLAEAFVTCGADYYIGPIEYPNGSAALMYELEFLYNYIHFGQDVQASHQRASSYPDDRQQFTLYKTAKNAT